MFRPAGASGAVGTLDNVPHPGLIQTLVLEHSGPKTVSFHHNTQKQMLRTHIAMAQFTGGDAGIFNGQFCPLSEFFIALYKAYPLGSSVYNNILSTARPAKTDEKRGLQEKLLTAFRKIIFQ